MRLVPTRLRGGEQPVGKTAVLRAGSRMQHFLSCQHLLNINTVGLVCDLPLAYMFSLRPPRWILRALLQGLEHKHHRLQRGSGDRRGPVVPGALRHKELAVRSSCVRRSDRFAGSFCLPDQTASETESEQTTVLAQATVESLLKNATTKGMFAAAAAMPTNSSSYRLLRVSAELGDDGTACSRPRLRSEQRAQGRLRGRLRRPTAVRGF